MGPQENPSHERHLTRLQADRTSQAAERRELTEGLGKLAQEKAELARVRSQLDQAKVGRGTLETLNIVSIHGEQFWFACHVCDTT